MVFLVEERDEAESSRTSLGSMSASAGPLEESNEEAQRMTTEMKNNEKQRNKEREETKKALVCSLNV